MATYDLTSVSMPATLAVGDILNCPYSGAKVSIVLPAGKYKLECWGAQGGYRSSTTYGGKGGYSKGTLVTESDIDVFLYAGGAGGSGNSGSNSARVGGFNGGGYRYKYPSGGGASDIRLGSDSLYARVIVAGGGGSDGASGRGGGAGGGVSGQATTASNYGTGGTGGQATYSGSSTSTTATTQATSGLNSSTQSLTYGGFGFGGAGLYRSEGYGGAGGGGWYGGQGTVPDGSGDDDKGGGGGSGYVYTSATASQYPSGCMLTANNYLLDATTHAGNTSFTNIAGTGTETGHTGNGAVKITVLEVYSDGNGTTKIRKEKIRIQHKGDTQADWNPNYILMRREIGIETDTGKMKIGNGVSPWSKLPYTKVDGFTTPQMLNVYLDSEQSALIGNGNELANAGVWGVLPIEKGGTGATDIYSAWENLGVAPEYHSTTDGTLIGPGNPYEYGHNRTTSAGAYFGPWNTNLSYSQSYIDYGYVSDFNGYFSGMDLVLGGQYGISFDMATGGIPSTLTSDAEGSTSFTVFLAVLNVYNIDNVTGFSNGKTVKQQLIIPQYNLTYERYVTVDINNWEATGTIWINTSRQGAPSEKIDFATKGGGRFYFMGRQPIPELEKAFTKPEDDTGTYVGQLSEALGGWHVTVTAAIPTITIKRYNADKTQSSTKTITVDSTYGASKLICMDKENGRIFVIFYQATNYPYGGAVQFQLGGAAIDSAVTQGAVSSFSASNWNSSGSERQFTRCLAFNNTCFFTTTSGGYEGNYAWDDYVCLSKITNTGSVSSGVSRQGYYNGLYTNGTDLYVEYEDDASTSSYPTRYYEYIFKYPNGDLSNSVQLWNDTYYSDDKWYVEKYVPEADKFILENREQWSSSWEVTYYSVDNNGTRASLDTGGNIVTFLGTSPNYLITQLQGAYDGWAYKETGNGIGLINLSTGKLDFLDIYCNNVLSYARFDENTNTFYIGTKDNYEFVYTIV